MLKKPISKKNLLRRRMEIIGTALITSKKNMQNKKMMSVLCLLCILMSCHQAGNQLETPTAQKDSVFNSISSVAAIVDTKHQAQQFIRTANLKFSVKNVATATYDIEEITRKNGGFVTFTHMASNISNQSWIAISADSTLETTHYQVTNTITLSVPNTMLDTTLKEIARNVDFLDFRIIEATDVSLLRYANSLAAKRAEKAAVQLTNAIDSKGKKLSEITPAHAILASTLEQADHAMLSNLSLTDQIKFSTVKIAIYQREAIKREVMANYKNIAAYEPGFGSKLLAALSLGLELLKSVVLFFAKFWAVFLILTMGYVVYKKYWVVVKK
jgi:hypothetical protein